MFPSRLAALATRNARSILVAIAALAIASAIFALPHLDRLEPFTSDDPSSESIAARKAIEQRTGFDPLFGLLVMVDAEAGVRTNRGRAQITRIASTVRRDKSVARIVSFYDSRSPAMVSRDGSKTFLVVSLRPAPIAQQLDAARRLKHDLSPYPGVEVGGRAMLFAEGNDDAIDDLACIEMIALPLLFLLSLLIFRGLIAALLPMVTALATIVVTLAGVQLVAEFTNVSIFSLNVVTALGLGLAIDYSLLLLSRYREEALVWGVGLGALKRTLSSTGYTIMFSALIVAGCLGSLLVFPQTFLRSFAIGGVMVALVAATMALLLLPAMLALLGRRVDSLAPKRLQRAADREASGHQGGWYRFSRFVMRHPALLAASAACLLLVLASPLLGLRPTTVDTRVVPRDSSARQVQQTLDRQFPINVASPIYVVARFQSSGDGSAEKVARLAEQLGRLRGVATVTAPQALGHIWEIDITNSAPPLSEKSQQLIRQIRAVAGPARGLVGGESASLVDLRKGIAERLPFAIFIVVMVTLIALFVMTGSVVLPIKALIMNAMSLGAALGVTVFVFQDGRLQQLLGYTTQGGLETSMLVLVFALVFGLSTDYGVFMLSRIKEAHDAGANDREAVAIGLERTGRIITAAALLFCVAVGALVAAQHSTVKEVGFAAALAVAIDASVVRALLVPSLMVLLGNRNWWAPAALRRAHSRIRPSVSQTN